jgi:hypothetical protein
MKFQLAILCLIAFSNPALAQYGISNQRDMYGNIVRDAGASSRTGINQGPVNNGSIRNSPGQPSTTSTGVAKGIRK